MMNTVLGLALFVSLLAQPPAQLPPGCEWVADLQIIVCDGAGADGGQNGTGNGTPVRSSPTTTLGYDLLWVPELADGPDGPCIVSTYQDLGGQPHPSDFLHSEMQFFRFMRAGYSMCPGAEFPAATTPALEAAQFLEQIDLPKPEPYIQPGKLPVGFDAYLETGAPTTRTFGPKATPFGDLTLTAEAQVYVDWDDPHDEVDGEHGPYTGDPGPYPDGEITHLYQYDGLYEITVRYEWVAEWRIGNAHSGTIPGANTRGAYSAPGFEVYSRQAVG